MNDWATTSTTKPRTDPAVGSADSCQARGQGSDPEPLELRERDHHRKRPVPAVADPHQINVGLGSTHSSCLGMLLNFDYGRTLPLYRWIPTSPKDP